MIWVFFAHQGTQKSMATHYGSTFHPCTQTSYFYIPQEKIRELLYQIGTFLLASNNDEQRRQFQFRIPNQRKTISYAYLRLSDHSARNSTYLRTAIYQNNVLVKFLPSSLKFPYISSIRVVFLNGIRNLYDGVGVSRTIS